MKNKIAIFLCFILILGVFSCTKKVKNPESKKNYGRRNYLIKKIEKNNYYGSGFEKEGNDYYLINIREEVTDRVLYNDSFNASIPLKYAMAIDAEFENGFGRTAMGEVVEYRPEPKFNKLNLNLYEIGTDRPVDTIDIKEIIDRYEDSYSYEEKLEGVSINNKACVKVDIEYSPRSVKENQEWEEKSVYIDLLSKDYVKSEGIPATEKVKKIRGMDPLFAQLAHEAEVRFYVEENLYWEGVFNITCNYAEKITENHTKLYEKFPDLKEKLEVLKKEGIEGKDLQLNIVLTGDPDFEEIAELIQEDGKEFSFENVIVKEEESVDGEEHQVKSFDEWRRYYKESEVNVPVLSPIFPKD